MTGLVFQTSLTNFCVGRILLIGSRKKEIALSWRASPVGGGRRSLLLSLSHSSNKVKQTNKAKKKLEGSLDKGMFILRWNCSKNIRFLFRDSQSYKYPNSKWLIKIFKYLAVTCGSIRSCLLNSVFFELSFGFFSR